MNITYGDKITFEDFNALRTAVGWTALSERQFNLTLHNAVFLCVAYDGGSTIGMTRAVGDGGYNLLVTDVVVHPDYHHMGIGSEMVSRLLAFVKRTTLEGETTMLNLMSAKGKEPFYEKFGFIARPTDTHGAGMFMYCKAGTTTE